MNYADGEVGGLDNDGALILFNGDSGLLYNCGETPEQFGVENMTAVERTRISR